ncbi:MAG: alpha-ribazole phosphatase [Deltaproteobacteria bacterium]|nr:alpha-ribazole phosphatase [Deltaproteobacteria bacterium]
MERVYLVRHGATPWNETGRFQGHSDIELSDLGQTQAAHVARRLARTAIEAVYTSPLKRAMETAAAIASQCGCTPQPDPRLREAHFGDWEGMTFQEFAKAWPDRVRQWVGDPLDTRPPGEGAETLRELENRAMEALKDILARHDGGKVVIVGHGGSIRAFITRALGSDLSIYRRIRLDNCSISRLEVHGDHFVIGGLNDTEHLDDGEKE